LRVCNLDKVPNIDSANALPPRTEGEPIAPVSAVPEVDPPVH
jgi:hypothetical protein